MLALPEPRFVETYPEFVVHWRDALQPGTPLLGECRRILADAFAWRHSGGIGAEDCIPRDVAIYINQSASMSTITCVRGIFCCAAYASIARNVVLKLLAAGGF